ncbi:MAG: winged helix-turn-helix domain-containing protein, partial [Deltaproteobacteria bacterium]|nr:winged helix-turn-helix domain-containing protein [Deltaproteobacteria bacterium]
TAVGSLEVHTERLELRWSGSVVTTTVTEFRLVETLAARPGVVFSREQLLRAIRDDDSVVVERIIDTYVRRMRRKFEELDAAFDRIETVIGAGYRWRD